MVRGIIFNVGILLLCGSSFANAVPASDASIRELLALTNARSTLDGMKGQIDGLMQTTMQQTLKGQQVGPEAQAILDRMRNRMVAATDETLQWDTLEPMYLKIYSESFTQDEIVELIALYKTPAGQNLVKKMPVVLQSTMAQMPAMMKPMLEKFRVIQSDAIKELQAAQGQNKVSGKSK